MEFFEWFRGSRNSVHFRNAGERQTRIQDQDMEDPTSVSDVHSYVMYIYIICTYIHQCIYVYILYIDYIFYIHCMHINITVPLVCSGDDQILMP